jgi:amino acid transporter
MHRSAAVAAMTSPAAVASRPQERIEGEPSVPAPATPGLRPGRLGVTAIAFFVVAAVAPMAAIVGGAPFVFASNGAAAPATFVLAGLLFAVFSVGYVTMSRHITNAGGFVAYVAAGLGTRAATAAAGLAILTYVSLQCALWGQYGVFAQATIEDKLGIDLPSAVWLFLTLGLVTALAYRGVDVSLRTLGFLLTLEIAALVILDVAIVGGGGASGASFAGFAPSRVFGPGLGIAFLFCVSTFTGFEATVVFSEEARNPRRTIPRAAYLSIAFIGGFYALTTWALSTSVGVDRVGSVAANDPAGFVFAIADAEVGSWLSSALEVLVVTSFIAMLIGFHNMFARYVFALGRAGALPAPLGVANAKTGSPGRAALTIGVTEATIVAAFLIAGADPITVLFSWLLSLGTVTLIVVLTLTCAAIIAFFVRTKLDTRPLPTKVAPAVAMAGFAVAGWLAVANYTTLLGGQGGVARWLLVLIPVAAIGGWVWGGRGRKNYSAELV